MNGAASTANAASDDATGRRLRVRRAKSVYYLDKEFANKKREVLSAWNQELCSGESLPEVEIISLLEEQIPRYKLRADTLTKFGGYENQDWFIPSPALPLEEADLKLSPDQIRETLNYFLLCSNRVSQMTSTYDDIEAVTRLLEEKEKDLELTARIGKELLQQNSKLENTIASLENELRVANEKNTQLTHENNKKTELIQILSNDMDDASSFENISGLGKINLDFLQKHAASLAEENKVLKHECQRLSEFTTDAEAQEQRLLMDITGQLACANSSMTFLEDELDRVKEENRLQHEQILALTAKLQDTELKLHKFMTENDEMNSLLQITKDNQGSIAIELAEFKARYYEVEALLRDAQEQLRKLRKKQMPVARSALFSSLGTSQAAFDSLQNELAMSMHSEYSMDSGISNDNLPQYKRVFDTVRCASQSSLSSGDSLASLNNFGSSGIGGFVTSSGTMFGSRMASHMQGTNNRRSTGSIYSSSSLGYPSLDSTGQSDNESFHTDSDSDGYPAAPQKGIPGAPGAADLEAALKRLTPGEVLQRRANLQCGHHTYGGYEGTDTFLPYGCRTPDSLMSTGSYTYQPWKLPEKLQIVKPLEGSQSLHQWSQLAQPTLSGLLEERPGVKIKGGKELEDIGLEQYGLSDLEEDEEYGNPGKGFDTSAPTYTLTNSTVMHPDDGTTTTFVTPSNRASRVASVCSSIQNSPPQTPNGVLSRRNSCSTFSTTLGLAKMLNERGIKAVTPSAYNTPSGVNSFTPTATPCNSPDGSPCSSRSRSPEPYYESFSLPQLLLSSMPEFVQQTIGGTKKKLPPHSKTSAARQKRSKQKETLVNKIERIGISTMLVNPGNLTISAGLYARPSLTSPMAQLTCLLPSQSTENLKNVTTGKPPLPPSSVSKHNIKSPSTPTESKKIKSSLNSGVLGVPGRPGSDSLAKRLEQLNNRKQRRVQGMTRPDLGTVSTKNSPQIEQQQQQHQTSTTLGTLSTLLFGRKGGLF
nr:trafficking kinesin-binding protein milt isoform X1 [Onthophagus taurus]